MNLADMLLPLIRTVASDLTDNPELKAQADADVQNLEALAAKHATALEQDVRDWFRARLYAG